MNFFFFICLYIFVDILAKTGMGLGAHVDVTGTNGSGIAASNPLCPVGFLNGCSCFAVSRHFAFYLRSGNGVWDSALVFDNYTAGTGTGVQGNVFAVSQACIHPSLLCLIKVRPSCSQCLQSQIS